MSACAEWRELLGGYVLGALEPEEAEAVRHHLAGCPECRRAHDEVAGVPPVLELLDAIEPLPEPPARLEQALLERFSRERPSRERPSGGAPPRRRLPRRRALAFAGAAVAALVAALALSGVLPGSAGEESYGHVRLSGRPAAAAASAELHEAAGGTRVRLRVAGLPAGWDVYDVWCIRDDGRWVSGGSFRVDRSGRADVTLTAAVKHGEYDVMQVTRRSGEVGEGRYGTRLLRGRVEY